MQSRQANFKGQGGFQLKENSFKEWIKWENQLKVA